MKQIYLVQKMQRVIFDEYARKGVKVKGLDCYGEVQTLWCESKKNAIKYCREQNREHDFLVYFVRPLNAY